MPVSVKDFFQECSEFFVRHHNEAMLRILISRSSQKELEKTSQNLMRTLSDWSFAGTLSRAPYVDKYFLYFLLTRLERAYLRSQDEPMKTAPDEYQAHGHSVSNQQAFRTDLAAFRLILVALSPIKVTEKAIYSLLQDFTGRETFLSESGVLDLVYLSMDETGQAALLTSCSRLLSQEIALTELDLFCKKAKTLVIHSPLSSPELSASSCSPVTPSASESGFKKLTGILWSAKKTSTPSPSPSSAKMKMPSSPDSLWKGKAKNAINAVSNLLKLKGEVIDRFVDRFSPSLQSLCDPVGKNFLSGRSTHRIEFAVTGGAHSPSFIPSLLAEAAGSDEVDLLCLGPAAAAGAEPSLFSSELHRRGGTAMILTAVLPWSSSSDAIKAETPSPGASLTPRLSYVSLASSSPPDPRLSLSAGRPTSSEGGRQSAFTVPLLGPGERSRSVDSVKHMPHSDR